MIFDFDRCLSIGWSLGAILRLRRKRRGRRTALLFEPGAVHSVPSALLLRSSSFVDLPPTFCVSRVLACYASVWGPEYLWTIALYWGYKIRNLRKIRKFAVTSFSDDSLVFVSSFLATQ